MEFVKVEATMYIKEVWELVVGEVLMCLQLCKIFSRVYLLLAVVTLRSTKFMR